MVDGTYKLEEDVTEKLVIIPAIDTLLNQD